jgi:hypothetical protein
MRIKNLERAFDERIGEIKCQLSMNLIGTESYENEVKYAQVALDQLKKKEFYSSWNRHFGQQTLNGYEHDKELYTSVVSFARYAKAAVQDLAQRFGISEGEVVSAAEFRNKELKKRLGKKGY